MRTIAPILLRVHWSILLGRTRSRIGLYHVGQSQGPAALYTETSILIGGDGGVRRGSRRTGKQVLDMCDHILSFQRLE